MSYQNVSQELKQNLALTQGMQQSLQVLRMGSGDIARLLRDEADRNPFLLLSGRRRHGSLPTDFTPDIAAGDKSLAAHVESQIRLNIRDPFEQAFAMHLATALEPTGWLGRPLEDLARDMAMPLPTAESILAKVQEFEPAGLFARSLRECLTLQATEAGKFHQLEGLLANLDLLAGNSLAALQAKLGLTTEELTASIQILRGFDPKPGLRFSHDLVAFMPCDLKVAEVDGAWQVEVNDDALPVVRVDTSPLHLASRKEHRALVELARSARDLERMVSRRKATLLKVGTAIIARQQGFLRDGWIAMLPLSLADIAQDTGLHSSTVSRAVSSTMIETPRGTIALRAFFARSVDIGGGGVVAQASLLALVSRIIADEDPARPLTDEQVMQAIRDMNLEITRRTVANHRETLRIPVAAKRRSGQGLT